MVWKLGTRGSALATAQSGWVARKLEEVTGEPVELVIIKTRGDAITDRPLKLVGGKGLFTKEIEVALLDGSVDFAVHSMKDMPTEDPEGLIIAAIPEREDPRDVLVGATMADLHEGDVVGTGSARRRSQLAVKAPGLDIQGIRGNVDTRIHKQRSGQYKAVVLAAAGIRRLGRGDEITEALDPSWMIPAVGQGALAVQAREGDERVLSALAALDHADTRRTVVVERAFLAALGGGCSIPAAAHATLVDGGVRLDAFLATEDETRHLRRSETWSEDVAQAAAAALASEMKASLEA